ncbi:MAG: hypothetical protein KDB27_07985 [Planctomycetales bacterium]|nr:hypothetical protein [Planctomycetales bacterium]
MYVDQAVFASSRNTQASGYQLVSRSRGIDEQTATTLRDWGPSQGALLSRDVDASAYSYYTLGPDRAVVSRTIYGGPEYSQRGELEVYTRSIVVSKRMLENYDNNPWWLIKTIQTLGYFRLTRQSEPWMVEVDLPSRSLLGVQTKPSSRIGNEPLSLAVQSLQMNRPVALIGKLNIDDAMTQLMSCLGVQQRTRISFTTGMVPSVRRPFLLHLFPQGSATLNSKLIKLGISPVDC